MHGPVRGRDDVGGLKARRRERSPRPVTPVPATEAGARRSPRRSPLPAGSRSIAISTRPAFCSNRSTPPRSRPWRARTQAVPTLGWPANGISAVRWKIADAGIVGRIVGGQHEGGLAVVHLRRQGLHLRVGHPARVGEDRERIAAEGAVGEDVDGLVRKARHGQIPKSQRTRLFLPPNLAQDLRASLPGRSQPRHSGWVRSGTCSLCTQGVRPEKSWR